MSRQYRKPVSERWADALSRVTWDDFERRLAEYYRARGYRVEHTGTAGKPFATDGGIDLKLFRDSEYIVVQCKHWNALQVTHNPMHELIGVMHTQCATGAIIITSGEFTRAAWEAAANVPAIQLIDGARVREMIGVVDEPGVKPEPPVFSPHRWATLPRAAQRSQGRRALLRFAGTPAAFAIWALSSVVFPLVLYFGLTAITKHFTYDMIRDFRATNTPSHPVQPVPSYRIAAGRVPAASAVSGAHGTAVISHSAPIAGEDLKTWNRKNAESMRILESTTPTLGARAAPNE